MNYKYCPYCGSEVVNKNTYFECTSCKKKTFVNSKPAAGIVVIDSGKFLISKRAMDPMKGYYDVIGGFLNNGEHPEDGAIRETKEETGLDVKIVDSLGIYIDKDYIYQGDKLNVLVHVYVAEIKSGKMVSRDDVASLHWFPIDKPPTKIASPWMKKAFKDLRKYKSSS